MKIKQDFITNSSSTSFILALKNDLNKESFYKSIGLKENTDLDYIFFKLFEAIEDRKMLIEEYIKSNSECKTIKEFLQEEGFDNYTIEIILEKISLGEYVYYGTLSSDNNEIESFFCCESFIVHNEDIYFNGEKCAW